MSLNDVWFWLFVAIIAGYLILDGFDLGVGMLDLFVARTDDERALVLNSIGPDLGRERGLAGGGWWCPVRGVPDRLRRPVLRLLLGDDAGAAHPDPEDGGDRVPQQAASRPRGAGSGTSCSRGPRLALALLLGVAFGNVIAACRSASSGDIQITSLLALLHPFALVMGLTTVADARSARRAVPERQDGGGGAATGSTLGRRV